MDDNDKLNTSGQTSESMLDKIIFGLGELKKEGFTSLSVNNGLICGGNIFVSQKTATRMKIAGWKYWDSHGCWMFDCDTEE